MYLFRFNGPPIFSFTNFLFLLLFLIYFSKMMGCTVYPFGGIKRLFIRRRVEAYLYRTLGRADRDVTFFDGR